MINTIISLGVVALASFTVTFAQSPVHIKNIFKISATQGNLPDSLDDEDFFGSGIAFPGDIDADGIPDLAVGAHQDDDGGTDAGAVYILGLNRNGTVKGLQKISNTSGGLGNILEPGALFGLNVSNVTDSTAGTGLILGVGAHGADGGGIDRGESYLLNLKSNGQVNTYTKIGHQQGGFGSLNNGDFFGKIVRVGDIDGNGYDDLAIAANGDDTGGNERGAIYILLMDSNSTILRTQKITSTLISSLGDGDQFGSSLTAIGDLDEDGIPDLAVGAILDDDGGTNRGAIYILFLNASGTLKHHQKISELSGWFGPGIGEFHDNDWLGYSMTSAGDLDKDGNNDLIIGAAGDPDGAKRGALYIFFLNKNGTRKAHQKIDATDLGQFAITLDDGDRFGSSVTSIGDFDGNGVIDFVVGALGDDDGGTDRGAVYLLLIERVDPVTSIKDDIWQKSIQVYPNPSSKSIQISSDPNYLFSKITIRDVQGRLIYNNHFSRRSKYKISVERLPEGKHYQSIEGDTGIYKKQISIQ